MAQDDDHAGSPAPQRSARSRRRALLSGGLLLAMVAFVAIALQRNWTDVREDLGSMGVGSLATSFLVGTCALVVAGWVWLRVLAAMGGHLSRREGATVFFSGQLGKYIPGSVWPMVIQAELGRAHGIPRSTMSASYLAAFAASLGAGGTIGLLTLLGPREPGVVPVVALGCVGGVLAAVAALHPRGLMRLGGRVVERFGRRLPPIHLPTETGLAAAAASLFIWCLFGLHCWLLARPLGADLGDLPPTVGAFALAFVAGLIVVPIPAGAGVREGVLVLVLSGTIGRQSGLSVAVASRLLLIAAEILLALVAGVPHSVRWAMARRADRLAATADPGQPGPSASRVSEST